MPSLTQPVMAYSGFSQASFSAPKAPKSLLDRISVTQDKGPHKSVHNSWHRRKSSGSTTSGFPNYAIYPHGPTPSVSVTDSSAALPAAPPPVSPVSVDVVDKFLDSIQQDLVPDNVSSSVSRLNQPSLPIAKSSLLPAPDLPSLRAPAVPAPAHAPSSSHSTNVRNTILLAISRTAQSRPGISRDHVNSQSFKSASETIIADKGCYASLLESLSKAKEEMNRPALPREIPIPSSVWLPTGPKGEQPLAFSRSHFTLPNGSSIGHNSDLPVRQESWSKPSEPPHKRSRGERWGHPFVSEDLHVPYSPTESKFNSLVNIFSADPERGRSNSGSFWEPPPSDSGYGSMKSPSVGSTRRSRTRTPEPQARRGWGKASSPLGPAGPPPLPSQAFSHTQSLKRKPGFRDRSASPVRVGHISPTSPREPRRRAYSPRYGRDARVSNDSRTSPSPHKYRRRRSISRSTSNGSPTSSRSLPVQYKHEHPKFNNGSSSENSANRQMHSHNSWVRSDVGSTPSLEPNINESMVTVKPEPAEEQWVELPGPTGSMPEQEKQEELSDEQDYEDMDIDSPAPEVAPIKQATQPTTNLTISDPEKNNDTQTPDILKYQNRVKEPLEVSPSTRPQHLPLVEPVEAVAVVNVPPTLPSQPLADSSSTRPSHFLPVEEPVMAVAASNVSPTHVSQPQIIDSTPRPILQHDTSFEVRIEDNALFLDGQTPGIWLVQPTASKSCVQEVTLVLENELDTNTLDLKLVCLSAGAVKDAFGFMEEGGIEEVVTRVSQSEHQWPKQGSLILQMTTTATDVGSGIGTGVMKNSWMPKDFREKQPLNLSGILRKGRNVLKIIQLRAMPDRIIVLQALRPVAPSSPQRVVSEPLSDAMDMNQ